MIGFARRYTNKLKYDKVIVFKHPDPANARAEVQGLLVDDEPLPGRPGQGCGRFRLHRPQVRDCTITNMNVTNLMALLRLAGEFLFLFSVSSPMTIR